MSHTIIPAILDQNIDEVGRKIELVQDQVDLIHIDILDGIFADNITIGVSDLSQLNLLDNIKFDFHLMTEYPAELLGECLSNRGYRVLAQIEKMHSQAEYVDACKEMGLLPGLALDLHTPVDSIEVDLNELDGILLMSVKAGFSGQDFHPEIADKIKELRTQGFTGHIVMDGGMSADTIKLCKDAGADQFGVTSYLWKSQDPLQTLSDLSSILR